MVNETITTGLPSNNSVTDSLITYTNVIYALHALAVVMGVLTSATIVLSFVASVPSIIAVIMNYVRRSEVRGTFLDSHFSWQIRTFWFAALWTVIHRSSAFQGLVTYAKIFPSLTARITAERSA